MLCLMMVFWWRSLHHRRHVPCALWYKQLGPEDSYRGRSGERGRVVFISSADLRGAILECSMRSFSNSLPPRSDFVRRDRPPGRSSSDATIPSHSTRAPDRPAFFNRYADSFAVNVLDDHLCLRLEITFSSADPNRLRGTEPCRGRRRRSPKRPALSRQT